MLASAAAVASVACAPFASTGAATNTIDLGVVRATSTPAPWFGLVAPTQAQLNAITHSSITRVTLGAGWNTLEPTRGGYNSTALAALASSAKALRGQGLQVVLDLGLQYPPQWAFALPGPTRFVDQYGEQWHGSLSTDVVNAVFNSTVRQVQADYIKHVAAAVGVANIVSVRVGGLLSGELRYPPASYHGHVDLIWDYDNLAQSRAPVRNWRPGSGTAAQAKSALGYYFSSLTAYQTWMMRTVSSAFPTVDQEVLFPSWGLRPGMVDAAISTGMHNTTTAEINGMISSGLDWANQVEAIAQSGVNATIYGTWLDAPSQGSDVTTISPIQYLARLGAQYGLPVAGENSGGGGSSALALCRSRMLAYHLTGMMYMSGPFVSDGTAGVTLNQLLAAASGR